MNKNRSPIIDYHLQQGAQIKQYGSWDMPAWYTTFEEEYNAIRNNIGIVDMSCMTKIKITGVKALEWLDKMLTGNILSLSDGKSIYTCFCDDNGYIITLAEVLQDGEEFIIFAPAEKREILLNWLNKNIDPEVNIQDITEKFACFTIIGPKAVELSRTLISEDIVGLQYLSFVHNKVGNIEVVVYRFGLTGEFEYRIIVPYEYSKEIWYKIVTSGKEYNAKICGLEILHTLMMEMKSVNPVKDIKNDTTPLQAGLHWMINFRKENFIGKEALLKEKEIGSIKKLMSCIFEEGSDVENGSSVNILGEKVGEVVNTSFSITLGKMIGLAYIDSRFAWVGLNFEVDTVSGKKQMTTVSAPLFITKTVRGARE